MDRMEKIALIGALGYQRQSADLQLDCFPWDKVADIGNLRDYDVVLLDLLSLEQVTTVDWSSLFNSLNPQSMAQILGPGGRIIVIGDPRFSIRRRSPNGREDIEEPFLAWTGVNFDWDNQPGDTVVFHYHRRHSEYEEYLKNLKHWDYSLRNRELNLGILGEMYDLQALRERKVSLTLLEDDFCENRYGGALGFTIKIAFQREERHTGRIEYVQRFGPVVFLPKIDLSEDETLVLVLRDLCGVESALPEPEWIAGFEAPGQKPVDDEIRQIRAQIESLLADLRLAEAKREEARACLKLLYERGEPLEKAVGQILRGLGADVEDPETPGKEDGWVTVQVAGETLKGVLEVKSTRNPQFDEQGLRQLLDWINRGVELRQKKYKGIFVGSNSVDEPIDERPWAFSDSWMKSAELHEIVAIKAEDLYVVHVLNASGKLDTGEFWRRLFGTRGVFDGAPYVEMLLPKGNESEA